MPIIKKQALTKADIKDKFNDLRRFNYQVRHFSSDKYVSRSNKGFPDIHILGHGKIYYIEVKLGRDKLSDEQHKFMDECLRVVAKSYNAVRYFIVNEENVDNIVALITEGGFREKKNI